MKTFFRILMNSIFTGLIFDSLRMSSTFPCILFFGEYKYPDKSDYEN